MMNTRILLATCLSVAVACSRQAEPYGPVPTPAQMEWQQMEMNMFVHFGPNTFSGLEWGTGLEPEDLFRPTELDCRQWARTAKAAGMKGIIVTAKHHDGFCLWPNPASQHCVKDVDVLKELSDACREEGLKFGVYISPWDRNDPTYGTPEYNQKYVETLQSVHNGTYGPIFEHWFDGACGEGPTGKRQEYDWPLFHSTVASLQPDAIQFSDVGPGCRWVGNENGHAGETNWSTLNADGYTPGLGAPPTKSLTEGDEDGTAWIPAEADVSIRPGWFWRSSEDNQIKSVEELMDIYLASVGRNAVLLLNVPADTRGKIPTADSLPPDGIPRLPGQCFRPQSGRPHFPSAKHMDGQSEKPVQYGGAAGRHPPGSAHPFVQDRGRYRRRVEGNRPRHHRGLQAHPPCSGDYSPPHPYHRDGRQGHPHSLWGENLLTI